MPLSVSCIFITVTHISSTFVVLTYSFSVVFTELRYSFSFANAHSKEYRFQKVVLLYNKNLKFFAVPILKSFGLVILIYKTVTFVTLLNKNYLPYIRGTSSSKK